MIKIKDFWKTLCDKYEYRFFSGTPCEKLKLLYNTMDPSFMHFIPTTSPNVALGIANGVSFTKTKVCVLLDDVQIKSIYTWLNFSMMHKLPILLIVATDNYKFILNEVQLPYKVLEDNLDICLKDLSTDSPSFLFIGAEVLK